VGTRVLVLSPTPTHPQDCGSRKRVFETCRRLSNEGARVTFVHYAADQDRGGRLPWNAERAMATAWFQYYTIAPSRRADSGEQPDATGWWDPAIEHFLRWLFAVQSFDVFIVNHCWLSRSFESAPAQVFRILDMRGQLPAAPSGEVARKESLDRANLVWAGSDGEDAAFQRVTATPVLTMPHVDATSVVARPQPDAGGYLRVGIIAASGETNRRNISRFIETAEPIFREAFAPVKLVIAGSVCGDLGRLDSPSIELLGVLENAEDFYRSVDCVVIPTETASGPGTQIAEAISFGVPVVSTSCGVEGYDPSGGLQGLATLADLARALSELAFAPRADLAALGAASRSAQARAVARADRAFRKSMALVQERRRTIVLAVDSRAFASDSIFNLALASVCDQLGDVASLTVLVAAGSAQDVVRNPAMVDRFGPIVVSRDLAESASVRGRLAALGVDVCDTAEFLRTMQPKIVIADALNPALFADCCPKAVIVTRTELVAFSEGSTEFDVPGARYRRAFAAAPDQSREMAGRMAASGAEPILEPCLSPSAIDLLRDRRCEEKMVTLLGTPRSPAMGVAARMAASWDLTPLIVYGIGERFPGELDGIACIRADAYVRSILKGKVALPQFAVDLSVGMTGLPLCRELLERLHIPTVSTSQVDGCVPAGSDLLTARSEGDLWRVFRSFAMDPQVTQDARFKDYWESLDGRHGWLWRYCTRVFERGGADQP
jgi:hypothetical protein